MTTGNYDDVREIDVTTLATEHNYNDNNRILSLTQKTSSIITV